MRVTALLALISGAALAAGRHHAPAVPAAPVPHFSLVVERGPDGWRAHCDSGCAWTDVSLACAGCDVRLDATGISRGYPARPGTRGFELVISDAPDGHGWMARGVRGVAWTRLSRGCAGTVCRGRLDERGVHGA